MMQTERKCAICGRVRSLFTLEIPAADGSSDVTLKFVCGSCWEVIAAIVQRMNRFWLEGVQQNMNQGYELLLERIQALEEGRQQEGGGDEPP